MAKDVAPDVWSVDVHADYQQLPGRPNIFARTHCGGCRYVHGECSWARNVPLSDAYERASILGETSTIVPGMAAKALMAHNAEEHQGAPRGPEHTYEVVEPMVAANIFIVKARTREEAIEKVLRGERDYVEMSEATPKRPLRASDARRLQGRA